MYKNMNLKLDDYDKKDKNSEILGYHSGSESIFKNNNKI